MGRVAGTCQSAFDTYCLRVPKLIAVISVYFNRRRIPLSFSNWGILGSSKLWLWW